MTANKILELARQELGTVEYPPNSNKVKYNTDYYGWEVSGNNFAWCAVFLWWLFQKANGQALYYGGQKTAYCPALLAYHTQQGQNVRNNYQPGDVIFFNFSGGTGAKHVGLCESWDGTYITTIDGNTGTGNEANGGAVMRRTRHKQYIVGAYRPAYSEEEETMTDEQFDQFMRRWLDKQNQKQPTETWMLDGVARAKAAGVSDGSRPMGLCTRVEAMMMAASKMTTDG